MSVLKKFSRNEDGSAVIPFAIWFPVFIMFMVSGIELGTISLRHTNLERAVDLTSRYFRLNPGQPVNDRAIANRICNLARSLPDCQQNIRVQLEMVDLRAGERPTPLESCTNRNSRPELVVLGENQEIAFFKVCYRYRTITGVGYLGNVIASENGDFVSLVSSSAFIIEPS